MKFVENENTELKKSTSELKAGIISIAAILNKHGKGELFFGVKNDGTVVGQDVGEKTLRDISQAISNNIEPRIFPEITREKYENLDYIKVQFQGTDKPYFAYGRVYLRVADEDKKLSPAEIEKMILQKNIYQSKWDSTLTKFKINDANNEAISDFIKQLKEAGRTPVNNEDEITVLEKLGLIKNNKLSFAAWHLFCDTQSVELQLALFRGKDKNSFKDIKPPIKTNLLNLLHLAENYVLDKINWRVEFGVDMKRKEIPEIPVNALREAIVNSIAHRNFNDPKANEIAVFSDRVEIYNPGTFPEGLTPEDYIKGDERSFLRNPKIAEMFFYTKDIDRWGSGLQRIDKECKENKIDYRFDILKTGFLATFFRRVDKSGKSITDIFGLMDEGLRVQNPKEWPEELVEEVSSRLVEKVGRRLAENQIKILILVFYNSKISKRELSKLLNISTTAIDKNIEKLKNKGLLKRIGPAKGGHWEVKTDG